MLFQGFRSNLRALLPLGVVFVVGITVAICASSLVDGGKLLELLSDARRGTSTEDAPRSAAGHARRSARAARRCCSARCARCRRCSRCGGRRRSSCSRTRAPARRWRRACAPRSRTGGRSLRYALARVLLRRGRCRRSSTTRASRCSAAAARARDRRCCSCCRTSSFFVADAAHLGLRELSRRVPRRRDAGAALPAATSRAPAP